MPSPTEGVCRDCGCTETNACVEASGDACYWAEPGLCSFCAENAFEQLAAPAVELYSEAEATRYLRETEAYRARP